MRTLTLLFWLAPALAVAQGTGTIAGRVVDDTGVGLLGATIIIEGTALGAATDADGAYRIIGVPVGTYDVAASFTGLMPFTQQDVGVHNGYTRTLDFALEGSKVYPPVVVPMGHPGGVNTDPFTSRVVNGQMIERLPVNR